MADTFGPEAATCPACGYHVAVLFYDGGEQPLATLGWPRSAGEARAMPRLPLRFVRCVDCGHVFNAAFDYTRVPYADQPNRMFNRGARWSGFMQEVRDQILERLPPQPVVVEIGHGEGHFLRALARERAGRYAGFDPHGTARSEPPALTFHAALFEPETHLAELKPDLIISRHVLEHLTNPLGFLQRMSFAASVTGIRPALYLEVPCIDRALVSGRSEDFYYEHNSHFTTESFSRMLRRSFTTIDALSHGYHGEVVYAFLRLKGNADHLDHARAAAGFRELAASARQVVALQLADLYLSGKRVAIWGGTGKSAAFIHAFGVDAVRFPLVVDSDPDKAGTYVPGAGQRIQFRDVLRESPADIILIPTQWRAADIVAEIHAAGIRYTTILIEHGGRLVDFFTGDHPYRRPAEKVRDGKPTGSLPENTASSQVRALACSPEVPSQA